MNILQLQIFVYLLKTCVTSGYFCRTDQVVFFPWPANIETESQPVSANQNDNA